MHGTVSFGLLYIGGARASSPYLERVERAYDDAEVDEEKMIMLYLDDNRCHHPNASRDHILDLTALMSAVSLKADYNPATADGVSYMDLDPASKLEGALELPLGRLRSQ